MTRSLPVIVLFMLGCPWGPESNGPPCEDDVNGCGDDSGTFVEDPTCELTGELDVELGQGQDTFTPIAEGEIPKIFNGFQGGQHVWLGVRVKNPDLERPSLKINITLSDCASDCEDPANWSTDNERELVVGSRDMVITDEGWFELASILVTLGDWSTVAHRRAQLVVTDPCSRQGSAVTED